MTRGEKLYYLRQKTGMSLRQAAEVIGVDVSTLSRYESDEFFTDRREIISRICRLYQVPEEYLMTENGLWDGDGAGIREAETQKHISMKEMSEQEVAECYRRLGKRERMRLSLYLRSLDNGGDVKKSQ